MRDVVAYVNFGFEGPGPSRPSWQVSRMESEIRGGVMSDTPPAAAPDEGMAPF